MSIKKILILAAACSLTIGSSCYAGGPDAMHASSDMKVYVDGHFGYLLQDWNKEIAEEATIWASPAGMFSNNHGGIAGGADIGIQLLNHFAVELGSFYLPRIKGQVNGSPNIGGVGCGDTCVTGKQYNWMAYAAGKLSVPLSYVNGVDIFAKVGAAARFLSNVDQEVINYGGAFHNWSAIFGAGAEYSLSQTGVKFGFQWLYLPRAGGGPSINSPLTSADKSAANKVAKLQPSADIFTGSVGYQFSI